MSFHTLIIAGYLGRAPEMRYTPNGHAVTSLSVAANKSYTDANGQKVKETTWFNVSLWDKNAENANTYLQKGSMVLIEGELRPDKETGNPRVFTRSNDGTTGAAYEVFGHTVRFLSKQEQQDGSIVAVSNEDVPF